MEILYKVHNNLYVNLTNRCPYACTFCLRQTMDRIGESDRLWLEREPLAKEVIDEFAKFNIGMDQIPGKLGVEQRLRQRHTDAFQQVGLFLIPMHHHGLVVFVKYRLQL